MSDKRSEWLKEQFQKADRDLTSDEALLTQARELAEIWKRKTEGEVALCKINGVAHKTPMRELAIYECFINAINKRLEG